MALSGRRTSRFNLLCLEQNEEYFEDTAVHYTPPANDAVFQAHTRQRMCDRTHARTAMHNNAHESTWPRTDGHPRTASTRARPYAHDHAWPRTLGPRTTTHARTVVHRRVRTHGHGRAGTHGWPCMYGHGRPATPGRALRVQVCARVQASTRSHMRAIAFFFR